MTDAGIPARAGWWIATILLLGLPVGRASGLELQVVPERGFGGSETTVHVRATHAGPSGAAVKVGCRLTSAGSELANEELKIEVNTQQEGEASFTAALPGVRRPQRAVLELHLADDTTEERPFWIFPTPEVAAAPVLVSPQVVFVDASPELRDAAAAAQARCVFADELRELPEVWRIAVVNHHDWAGLRPDEELAAFVAGPSSARRVVILVGPPGQAAVPPSVVPDGADNLLLTEVSPEWTTSWDVPGWPFPPGNFRPIVTWSGSDGAPVTAPLLEIPPRADRAGPGKGFWILRCGLPVLDRFATDPAAASLLSALVRYAVVLGGVPSVDRAARVLARADDPVAPYGLPLSDSDFTRGVQITGAGALLVHNPGPQVVTLPVLLERQAVAVLVGLQPGRGGPFDSFLPAYTRIEQAETDEPSASPLLRKHALTAGLTQGWLREILNDKERFRLMLGGEAEVEWLVDGYAATWKHKGAQVIAWQLPLNSPTGEAALRVLLTNIGIMLPGRQAVPAPP